MKEAFNCDEDGATKRPQKKDKSNDEICQQAKVLSQEEKKEKMRIMKNVLLISFSFFLHFTSYNSMSNLMSSLYKEMGNFASSVVYAGLILSCTILPTFMMKFLKPKNVVALCILLYTPYMACLFIPSYYSFMPTAFLLGLAGAPLWISKCTYLTKISTRYSHLTGQDTSIIITQFFGIFFVFFQLSQIAGNFISSAILSKGVENFTRSEEFLENCGINYCPYFGLNLTTTSTEDEDLETSKIHLMASIYVALAICAALIVFFLVNPISEFVSIDDLKEQSIFSTLTATLKQLKEPKQLLIIPLTMWSGLEQGFLSSDFTAGMISCSIGIHMVGNALVAYGVADALFSYGFSPLVKSFGRVPIFTLGAFLNLTFLLVLFAWTPDPSYFSVFFVLAIIWGIADAIWQTQINALHGIIFPKSTEGAFSNYRLWESLGFFIVYMGGGIWCTREKTFILLGFLLFGMLGYYAIEIMIKFKKKTRH